MGRKRRTKAYLRRVHGKPEHQEEKKDVPRSFVIRRGRSGKALHKLVRDYRQVMLPNTAASLRERRSNQLKDFVSVATPLGVTHMMIFSTDRDGSFMRLAKLPSGPTLTFKVNGYTLIDDVRDSRKKRFSFPHSHFMVAPLLVLNGFSGAKFPTDLLQSVLKASFEQIDVRKFSAQSCQRVAMFNRNEDGSLSFRHFSISQQEAGLSRGVRKLLKPTSAVPLMGRSADVADFVNAGGYGSESEGESVTSLTGANQSVAMSVKLVEIGPRMELELVKIEEGLCAGVTIFSTGEPSGNAGKKVADVFATGDFHDDGDGDEDSGEPGEGADQDGEEGGSAEEEAEEVEEAEEEEEDEEEEEEEEELQDVVSSEDEAAPARKRRRK